MGVPGSKHRPPRSGVMIRSAIPSGGVATDEFYWDPDGVRYAQLGRRN